MTYPNPGDETHQYPRPASTPGPTAYSADPGRGGAEVPYGVPSSGYVEEDVHADYRAVRPATSAYPASHPYPEQQPSDPYADPAPKKAPAFNAGVDSARFWSNVAVVCLVSGLVTLLAAASADAISHQVTETGGLAYSAVDYVFYGLVGFVGPAVVGLFWYIVHAASDIGSSLYTFATLGIIFFGVVLTLLSVRPWSTAIVQAVLLVGIGSTCVYFINLIGTKTEKNVESPTR